MTTTSAFDMTDQTHNNIRRDFEKIDKLAFDRRYPNYVLPNWDWMLRRRHENGLIESGALVETSFGSQRKRCLIVPALLNWRLYGEEPLAQKVDMTIALIEQTNERLSSLESKMAALLSSLSHG